MARSTDDLRIYAAVDLDAVAANMAVIRAKLPVGVKIMGVVKADGYGHGAVETAETILRNGAEQLGVACCEEGVSLRNAGVTAPVLILGYTPPGCFPEVVGYGLTQTVYNAAGAGKLSEAALGQGKTAAVHIKIDTGMGRLGFLPDTESVRAVKAICALPGLRVEGVYTHYAVADSAAEEDMAFTRAQYGKFLQFINALEANGVRIPLAHAANSGAVLNHAKTVSDMARVGLLTYGLVPDGADAAGFKPVMRLIAKVVSVKQPGPGASVGYGRTYVADKQTKIATVSAGYADGYPRYLSNKGRVIINGEYAAVAGAICMDHFMADVTHIKHVAEGDEAVLIGSAGDKSVTADEVAALGGTINYEIVCGVGKRVPRVYRGNAAGIAGGLFFK